MKSLNWVAIVFRRIFVCLTRSLTRLTVGNDGACHLRKAELALAESTVGNYLDYSLRLVNSFLNTRRTVGVGDSDWSICQVARAAMLTIIITIERSWESLFVIG